MAREEVLTSEQVGFEEVVVTYHHNFLVMAMCSHSFEATKSRNRNSLVVASEGGHRVDGLRCTRSGLGCGAEGLLPYC